MKKLAGLLILAGIMCLMALPASAGVLNQVDEKNFFAAANLGDEGTVILFLNRDPSLVNARDSEHGATPLHWAISGRQKKMVELLILRGADVNALATKKPTGTPLAWARSMGKGMDEIIDILKKNGARE
jgi:ankyrin repeat protein